MASSFLDFPTEVLNQILSHLSTTDQCTACLVDKRMQLVAEPFLYSRIRWYWILDGPVYMASRTTALFPPIIRCLQSISRRPQLATYVLQVTLEGPPPGRMGIGYRDTPRPRRLGAGYRINAPLLPLSGVDLGPFVSIIKNMEVPYGDVWIRELQSGKMDAFVALLLSQLPNLRDLYLGESFLWNCDFVDKILRSAIDETLPSQSHILNRFKKMSRVHIEHSPCPDNSFRRVDPIPLNALSLFYLPSIRSIYASVDNPLIFDWPGEHPPSPSTLESLELSTLREGHLGHVLSVTTALKNLRWNWILRPDTENVHPKEVIDLDMIIANIHHIRDTLNCLSIIAWRIFGDDDNLPPLLEVKGSFHDITKFHHLTHLDVPLPFLVGTMNLTSPPSFWQSLPRTIVELNIAFEGESDVEIVYLLESIRIWLSNWRENTPKLHKFHLWSSCIETWEWNFDTEQELKDLGFSVGIEIQMSNSR